jgi:hypothetical protein
MKPQRIQRKRVAGFDLQAASVALNGLPAIVVTRPGKWGNPFNFKSSDNCWNALALGCRGDAAGRQEASVRAFRQWVCDPRGRVKEMEFGVVIEGRSKKTGRKKTIPIGARAKAGAAPSITEIIEALRGKNLACFCALDQPCHADVLLEIANTPVPA